MISSQYVSRVTLLRDRVNSFERYPFSLPAIQAFESIDLHPKVTFFVGENGSGKSTLLEAMAVSLGFNAEGGSKNFHSALVGPTPTCMNTCASPKASEDRATVFSSGRKVFSTWPQRLRTWMPSPHPARR